MTFRPQTMDGQAAARRLLAKKTHPKWQCLNAVFWAFPFKVSDAPGEYDSARIQWERTPRARRRVGDRGVPAGAIVLFDLAVDGTRDPRPGHICISLGGNRVVTTDWPERGRIGIATIEQIEKKWNADYLGWTDVIGGHNVLVGPDPDAAPKPAKPQPAGKPASTKVIYSTKQMATDHVNLRSAPSTVNTPILAVIPAGKVVLTGPAKGSWHPVKYGSRTGWVHASYLIAHAKTVRAEKGLNLRKTATDRERNVIVTLKNGTKVTLLAVQGKTDQSRWVKVRAGVRTGWVDNRFLR